MYSSALFTNIMKTMSSKKFVRIVLSMSFDPILVSSVSGPYTELHECVYLHCSCLVHKCIIYQQIVEICCEVLTFYCCNNESTKVQNPRHKKTCLMLISEQTDSHMLCSSVHHVVNTIMRMRAFRRKNGRLYAWPYNGGSAGSLQRSGFRENPTNFLTFVTR